MSGAPEHRDKLIQRSHGDKNKPPLSPQHIGIYRNGVPVQEIVFIQKNARRSLSRFGYSQDEIHFSAKDQANYLFSTWPLNIGRMLIWLGIEFVQHNLPGALGRKPGSNMLVDTPLQNNETATA